MKLLKSFILLCVFFVFTTPSMAFGPGQKTTLVTATVAETLQAGGYRYVKLEEQGIWIAANDFEVSVGDRIQFGGGSEMKNFHSNSLDRTFDSIFFVQTASRVDSDAQGSMQNQNAMDMGIRKPEAVEAPKPGDIKTLEEGETVASIFSKSEQLNDQLVSLNARVIKVNKNIMGKNWITLQDGTGAETNNKLLTTSQQVVSPGDLVVATGKIALDVDLGSGYTYKVLLQDTTFKAGVE